MSFAKSFLAQTMKIAESIDADVIERVAARAATVRDRGGRIFFLGVGGGAGNAGHAVNDFRKIAGIECYAPTDNVSELTARINDEGWDDSFAAWLRGSRLTSRDAIFVFSVGGGSEGNRVSVNIVNAVKLARTVGSEVLGVVGRDGGFTARHGDAVVVVPTVEAQLITPHTESWQAVVWHLLVSHPALAQRPPKWESIASAAAPSTKAE